MAWPQAPQPAPTQGGGSQISLGPVITAVAGVLTFFFSFVRIYKVEEGGFDEGWSVWTTDFFPGLFGVGTWIPLLALAAAGLALARAFVPGLAHREVLGFSLLQLQLVAAVFAFLLWFGYLVSILLAGGGDGFGADLELGLGMLLLFLGLAGVLAGTALSLMEERRGATVPGGGGPWTGQPADTGQWQQQAPAGDTGQWQQQPQWDPAPQPAPQAPPAQPQWDPAQQQWQPPQQQQQWEPPQQQGAAQQWASDPQPWQPQPAPPGPVPEPAPADPQPAPPVDPQPEPAGGGLFDPGTQVIPGPPPAPPADAQPDGPPPPPAPPASAT